MAVEDGEAPGGERDRRHHRKADSNGARRQRQPVHDRLPGRNRLGVTSEARKEQPDQPWGQQDAEEAESGHDGKQQSEDGTRQRAGLAPPALADQPAVHRNEGRRKRLVSEQVLERVGRPERGGDDIRQGPGSGETRDDGLPDQPEHAAGQHAHPDTRRTARGTTRAISSGGLRQGQSERLTTTRSPRRSTVATTLGAARSSTTCRFRVAPLP